MKYPCPYFPYPLPKAEIAGLLKSIARPLVLDIGANDGADSIQIFDAIPAAEIHCFEPDARPFNRLLRLNGSTGALRVHNCAIGDKDGKAILYMSGGDIPGKSADWDLSSSIRKPTGHLVISPEISFDRQCEVDVIRLDTWFADQDRDVIDFIWADVQGGEGDLIRGGREALKQTRFLHSEFYDWPRYDGQPDLPTIMEALGKDWQLKGIYEGYNFLAVNRGMLGKP